MAVDNETMVAPTPPSPPKYPDLCGRRRMQIQVQILDRELGSLQEELQSLEGLQPVSKYCKEVHEFVGLNPDPLILLTLKRHRSCHFWKWLGSRLCFCFSWIFCCNEYSCQWKKPRCSCCPQSKNPCCCGDTCNRECFHCYSCPKVLCCQLPRSDCCSETSCCCSWNFCCCKRSRCCRLPKLSCCKLSKCCCTPTISCPEYSCGCIIDCPKCMEVLPCPKCSKPCCVTGCLC